MWHSASAAVAGATLAVTVWTAGCGSILSSPKPSAIPAPSATTASKTPPTATPSADYTDLLIAPDALGLPGEPYSAPAPTQNPQGVPGVSTSMVNRSDTHAVGDTIYLLPDPDAATTSLNGAKQSLDTVITAPVAQSAPVGDTGTIATGDSPDGTKAVTVVMFTRGRAFVTMEFDAAPGHSITSQLATQVAQRQDGIVKDKAPR
ncbi:hypothetical protein [Mycobacterium sp.]|jgi:hypothetical protein|uniref:hypothetical protein n=1 Tax=Mycobacterium sp. TaxID=1785 RepID=UPI0028B970A9|nr:hypothetical protein [Mycobacterium sp.]MDT5057678.1 hypothetical protein [Mycobacterium sp.]MDT5133703.1 hypothetical protein [Mycobacterium sp.]